MTDPTSGDRAGGDASGNGPAEAVSLSRLVLYFLRLGTIGFGGPIATVGYMQRDLVEKRAWINRKDFLDGVALGQTMPGPLAAQVAMWVGYLNRGAWGALAVAAAFTAPSFAIVVAVGALYAQYAGLGIVQYFLTASPRQSWRSSPSPAISSSKSPTGATGGSGRSAPRSSASPH